MPHRSSLVAVAIAVTVALGLPLAGAAYADDPVPAPSPTPSPSPSPTPAPPVATTVVLSAPARVVDERSVSLQATWTTTDGLPVVGGTLTFEQQVGGAWRAAGTRTSDAGGNARLGATPRTDTVWRVRGAASATWSAATSSAVRIDNVPPGTVVRLGGPAPRRLPAQPRAVGSGANVVVGRLGDATWRSMVGRSWHRGCPVGRGSLRLLRVNYWGFDGYRHRGEVVLAASVVDRAGAALADMHAQRLPLRSLYRVDRFGWSKRLQGADDHRSMASDNTSGFNCRSVVNRPGVRSPHASGRALDLNPWENPYRSRTGWVPNTWWVTRSHPLVAWRTADHPVVRIWRAHGFRWTYGTGDSQHWDGRQGPGAPTPRASFVG